ncbi:MAG TPA: hypothetical protein VL576_02755 [Candidatus Paceibacterota bacterium]|nr:hypothetical protein [Candidatus Paceibacterota bacterium]
MKPSKYVLVMKIGPFCGFSLEEIINIKTGEQDKIGKFFLGYSGVFCHPKRVSEFIQLAKSEGEKVTVLFITTPSNFNSPIERLSYYSSDANLWQPLPEEVLLVGSKFSIVAKDIQKVDFDINLTDYQSMLGATPGKTLDEYLQWRCDKSCAVYNPGKLDKQKMKKVSYICELTDEGVVYVK